jgi:hypothetical protein
MTVKSMPMLKQYAQGRQAVGDSILISDQANKKRYNNNSGSSGE